jgi:hypothetical protein
MTELKKIYRTYYAPSTWPMIYAATTMVTDVVISTAPVAATESSCQILDETSLSSFNRTGRNKQLSRGDFNE